MVCILLKKKKLIEDREAVKSIMITAKELRQQLIAPEESRANGLESPELKRKLEQQMDAYKKELLNSGVLLNQNIASLKRKLPNISNTTLERPGKSARTK